MKRIAKNCLSLLLIVLMAWGCVHAEELYEADLDLSGFNRAMTYAQISGILRTPEAFEGMIIRAKGQFNYSEKTQTAKIIFSDSAGCCEITLAFSGMEDWIFPDHYPPLYAQITVTGRLTIDSDDPEQPVCLTEALMEWDTDAQKQR